MKTALRLVLVTLACHSVTADASGLQTATPALQAPHWSPGFGLAGVTSDVKASVLFDDGSGEKLYIGGKFDLAGTSLSFGIARWDGGRFEGVGGNGKGATGRGGNTTINALVVHDLGNGPVLIAAGAFDRIDGVPAESLAAWDGTGWTAIGDLGPFGEARALASDASTLYVAGQFSSVQGIAASNIARLEQGAWSPLGTGLTQVRSLTIARVAGARELYAGRSTAPLARWDGAKWEDVPGTPQGIDALAALDRVGNGIVVMGGNFQLRGWNGTQSAPVTDDAPWFVSSLLADDSGPTPVLYAGGLVSGPAPNEGAIVRWAGTAWTPVGAPTPGAKLAQDRVLTMSLGSVGTAPRALFVGGRFEEIGGTVAYNVARAPLAGTSRAIPLGRGQAAYSRANVLLAYDDGSGPALYAGGSTGFIGTIPFGGVARLRHGKWEAVGAPFGPNDTVTGLVAFDDGTGMALLAIGRLSSVGGLPLMGVARWDGLLWSDVGGGLIGTGGNLTAAAVYDEGNGERLFVGGSFGASPALPGANIARWDGTSWTRVGNGLSGGSRNVQSLTVHEDGSGPKLYAGGDFLASGGTQLNGLARWDGSEWKPVGLGVNASNFDEVLALQSVDLPSLGGPALVAAGTFDIIGTSLANGVGVWRNGSWKHLDGGFRNSPRVRSLAVFDDGSGPSLYAAGKFGETNRRVRVSNIARWTGKRWSPLGTGIGRTSFLVGGVTSMASVTEAGEPSLFVAGGFKRSGNRTTMNLARWSRSGSTVELDDLTGMGSSGSTSGLHIRGIYDPASGVLRLHLTGGSPNTAARLLVGTHYRADLAGGLGRITDARVTGSLVLSPTGSATIEGRWPREALDSPLYLRGTTVHPTLALEITSVLLLRSRRE